ncbi:TetR/AcrR family transcriptional regulator [Streptomyces poonensis]|uniref:TetR family transcriptional regulator n=1 Tax=Streptomyces poonensis TaxID=68255 RepID=A0A918UCG7_9ACTN|nr:TetR/AcrR family transcriptional regulator [Streptomyces poonensis]GGY87384.1 TetR family transcriptional regulator [Streptomyces poonensis]GLJ90205.1 TetR family transcriptional regulator [Streptomyces poonensis]
MSIQTRRERERAERERLIVTAARELAEAEGWDAVTTRRLAAEIEYSQPVLYSHFKGKGAIMAAVAVQGCADLAQEMRTARTAAKGVREALAAVGEAYTTFGRRRPALYDAMFTHAVDLPFATPEAPAALQEAFGELVQAVEPIAARGDDVGLLTETYWAGLHGLVTLMRSGRLPEEAHEQRLALLIGHFTAGMGAGAETGTD